MLFRSLMTGAAGGLGVAMRPRLKQNCQMLRLSDVAPMAAAQTGEQVVQADLSDAQAVDLLVQGCQAIVHFGGVSTEQPWSAILPAKSIPAVIGSKAMSEPQGALIDLHNVTYGTGCRSQQGCPWFRK